jgi:ribosomal protein S18 acetylase RimI-like enzyme
MPTVSTRTATPSDEPFRLAVFAQARADVFDAMGLDPVARTQLIELQYRMQQCHYRKVYPASDELIIELDATPAGTLWLATGPDDIRVVDLAIASEYRRRGIASEVLMALLQRSPVSLSVWHENDAALALYQRLGLSVRSAGEDYLELASIR